MRGENFEVVISKERSRLRNLHDTGLLRFLPSVEMTGGIVEMTRGMVGMTRRMIGMTRRDGRNDKRGVRFLAPPLKSGADERI